MTAPFAFVSAFTDDPFRGNPAAIIVLDSKLPLETLQNVASTFNQPMAVFVTPSSVQSDDPTILSHDIRFITIKGTDSAICGHGSLAAAKWLFDLPQNSAIEVIHFYTHFGPIFKARKDPRGFVVIQLPAASLIDVPVEERDGIVVHVNEAFGRNTAIKAMKKGIEPFQKYLLVEIDEKEDLGGIAANTSAFFKTGFAVNIVTSSSSQPGIEFVSRMFSEMVPGGEDAVCGSAHSLLVPYWHQTSSLVAGGEFAAKQVSARGGDLLVSLNVSDASITLKGRCAVFAQGTFALP